MPDKTLDVVARNNNTDVIKGLYWPMTRLDTSQLIWFWTCLKKNVSSSIRIILKNLETK